MAKASREYYEYYNLFLLRAGACQNSYCLFKMGYWQLLPPKGSFKAEQLTKLRN